MKLFIDSGSLKEIKLAHDSGVIDGVTTNPTLIAKEGLIFEDVIKKISKIFTEAHCDCPVNAEVISIIAPEMVREALKLSRISKNVVVKIPIIPEGIKAIRMLSKKGIKTNATLCFSASQALLVAKAGGTYVSPFIGRIDDMGERGMDLIDEIRIIYDTYGFKTKILAASIRGLQHVEGAAIAGADIATIPFKVFESMFKHPLTDSGLKKFLADWKKYQKSLKNKQ